MGWGRKNKTKTKVKERKLNSKSKEKNPNIYHWNGKELKREVKKKNNERNVQTPFPEELC